MLRRRGKLIMFAMARRLGVFGLSARLTRARLRILCYHAFETTDESVFRPKLFMKPRQFRARMALLKRLSFEVLSLEEGLRRLRAGTLPRRCCVLTFDDGFFSVLASAAPVLKEYGWPATLYFTTYYAVKRAPVFGLVIQYLFWKCQPTRLRLDGIPELAGKLSEWASATDRERAMHAIIDCGDRGSQELRDRILRALSSELGFDLEQMIARKQFMLMSRQDIEWLAASGFDVQLHTHRHRFPDGDRAVCLAELNDNRTVLGEWLPGPFTHFCYPSGEWAPMQAQWLTEARVQSATTCEPGLATRASSVHALPRFLDGEDVTELEFEAEVSGFNDLVRGLRFATRRGNAHA